MASLTPFEGSANDPEQASALGTTRLERFNALSIHNLLGRLGWGTPLIVLIAAFGVIVPFYFLQARPLAETNAFLHQQLVADRVTREFGALAQQIDALLFTMRDWSRDGRIGLDDVPGFNGLLIPVIERHPLVSSLHLASESGRETLLLKTPEGWKNRLSNLPENPKRHQWLVWKDARSRVSEEWREQEYDMRKRPWFSGALAVPDDHVHWTAPYLFATTQEPGITASLAWTDRTTGVKFVAAFDVLLNDMSRLTTRLRFGKQGQVALLAADGAVLGLPSDDRFTNPVTAAKAVLRQPDAIGLPVLAAALRLAESSDGRETFRVSAEAGKQEEGWLVGVHPFLVHDQRFRVATFAPESDGRVISGKLLLILFGIMGAIALTAMFAARFMVSRVQRPVTRAFAQLAASHASEKKLTARRTLLVDIANHLQQADTPLALARTLLSRLSEPLRLGQGLFCLWNEAQQRLVPLARFASNGATPDDTARPLASLLKQCALERRPFILKEPGQEFFHIRSGLGDAAPRSVLLQPVVHAGRLFAVMELATFDELTEEDLSLIRDLQPTVAMSLDILLRAEHTAGLLAQATSADAWSRQILEAVDGGIFGVDESGRIIFINRFALRLFGLTETFAIGQSLADLLQGTTNETWHTLQQTLADGRARRHEQLRIRTNDHVCLSVNYACSAIERADRVVGAVVIFKRIDTLEQTAPACSVELD
ncbi:MAG: PAS domain-containing protein [Magnetococcus sp. YQC-9]